MLRFKLFAAAVLLFFATADLFAQGTANLQLLKIIDPAPGSTTSFRYSEVTGCGDLVALAGWSFGDGGRNVYLYDVSNPQTPQALATILSTGSVYDVQIHGKYLYLAVQNQNYIDVFDILDPRKPVLVNHFQPSGSDRISPHTFCVAGNVMYVTDNFTSVAIYDITDKRKFVRKLTYTGPFGTSHDNTIIRGKWYGAFIFSPAGLGYFDVTNPFAPRELAKIQYPGAGTHYAWPTEDERYILTADEIGATPHSLKIWDTQPAGQLTLAAEYDARTGGTIHNVYVRGRYAYMSYYCDGVRIVDLIDPTKPKEVASYNIAGAGNCSGYDSVWGMYPFSRYIYVSDMKRGLYVFNFDQHVAANFTGTVTNALTSAPIAGAYVYFIDEYPTTRSTNAGAYEIPWFKDGVVRVAAEASGYFADTASVNISASGATQYHFKLQPQSSTRVDDATSTPSDFDLLPSYPNPFSLRAGAAPLKIAYALPSAAATEVMITNTLGQVVKRLVTRNQSAGKYVVRWNGEDERGQRVSAGIYFVQLRAGERVLRQKLTLVR
ncbi:MAG: FlgD immunoglobulin-like domain containing protein [candidate division KSB1 bacterium]